MRYVLNVFFFLGDDRMKQHCFGSHTEKKKVWSYLQFHDFSLDKELWVFRLQDIEMLTDFYFFMDLTSFCLFTTIHIYRLFFEDIYVQKKITCHSLLYITTEIDLLIWLVKK